uniref:Uncharacterized protein n=1 Tax=Rangifer tarandus platyrhynchus TaxID=3082113 RepID=A0ACB0FJQ6_RANTA|nr:unnamed protein product [Rangifer tarandus platyrhynchus]
MDHSLFQGPLQDKRQQHGLCETNKREVAVGAGEGDGGGGGRVVGRLRQRRRSPGTPSPSAAIYRPRSSRFAPGPSCLLQRGSHQPRDNKQVHRARPRRSGCLRDPREAYRVATSSPPGREDATFL